MNTEKEKKYDRQLRLWGNHGQKALSEASVCLLNVTPTGNEVLKNLVLPGIGNFIIVDDSKISCEDADNDFFVPFDQVGKNKAECAAELLKEMNPDVEGSFTLMKPEIMINDNPDFFTKFTLVIACNMDELSLIKLSDILWKNDIPLVLCHSFGFVGYTRLVYKEMCVVESHPENPKYDFRLFSPFSELHTYVSSIDLQSMTSKQHKHVPYLVLMHKLLNSWKQKNNGEVPETYKQKKEFGKFVMECRLKDENGVFEDEENFSEAVSKVNTAFLRLNLSNIEKIINDPSVMEVSPTSKPFWILCRALNDFYLETGTIPLSGTLPDMISDSEGYIDLQKVYQRKATEDMKKMVIFVEKVYREMGMENNIGDADIKRFCKNVQNLKVVRSKSLEDEFKSCLKHDILERIKIGDDENLMWYVVVRSVQKFISLHSRLPKICDLNELKDCTSTLVSELGPLSGIVDMNLTKYLEETCKYNGTELNSVASFMGGVVAQEAIKLITSQYVPICHTFVYNGITSTTSTFDI